MYGLVQQSDMHNHTLPLLPLLKCSPTCAHMVSIAQTTDASVHRHGQSWGARAKVELMLHSSTSFCLTLRLLKKNV